MTSFRDCGLCGGSGRHSFERCFECKGTGMVEEPEESDDPDDEMEPDEEWRDMYQPWFL